MDITELKPGDEIRMYCGDCSTEFELTLEPKATSEESKATMPKKELRYCPFCGERDTMEEC